MRRFIALALFLFVIAGSSYCISFNRIIYPIKISDSSGYIMRQEAPPLRIISADPAVTEILFEFNLSERIVGITGNCDYPEGVKNIEKVGKQKIEMKKAVKLQPDLVIVELGAYKNDLEAMRKVRFTTTVSEETIERTLEVFCVEPKSLGDVLSMIDTLGTITNREHAAYSLLQKLRRRIDWVEARGLKEKHLKALVITSFRPLTAAAPGTFQGDLARKAGMTNVCPVNGSGYVKLDRKQIEKLDPDIIITSTSIARKPKDVYNKGEFRKTKAGVNKKAVCVEASLMERPGPRIVDALEKIANEAYGWGK